MTIQQARARFNREDAPKLAALTGPLSPCKGMGRARFAYFADEHRFAVVAGEQEGAGTDRALAYGLTYRQGRQLVLILPRAAAFPTLQRAAWLTPGTQPEIYVHTGGNVELADVPDRDASVARLIERLDGRSPADELTAATTPAYLGRWSASVVPLVEWAAAHPQLDPGHRRAERSWHCVGQRVLSIRRTRTGLVVRAGIHGAYPGVPPLAIELAGGRALSAEQVRDVQQAVHQAINARVDGPLRKADEHWLQAVIRRQPSLVGLEQPALRELPAWRPVAGSRRWGRGYIDLVGLDAHGDIRIVETKLADNRDDLLMLQGVDYYVWAKAYEDAIRQRLTAHPRSTVQLHYLIGKDNAGKAHVSRFVPAQAAALDIPWRMHCVTDWHHLPGAPGPASTSLLAPGALPGD